MNLYIAPANVENIEQTIKNAVSWNVIARYVSKDECIRLQREIDRKPIHCFAVTSHYKKNWESMRPGDRVLIKTNGADAFTWSASILTRAHSVSLGNALWPIAGDKPWEFIYFLENLKRINKSRKALVRELGYKEREVIQHFLPVASDRVDRILNIYGSPDAFIAALPDVPQGAGNTRTARVVPANPPRAEILVDPPAHLMELSREIERLKRCQNHQERGHESLVEQFYRAMGWQPHDDIQFQAGRIDVLIRQEGRPNTVNEVKRDWGLGRSHENARKQAYDYAAKTGARYVVVTNGDYYARYDRKKGDTYDENFEFDLRLTELKHDDFVKLESFRKCDPAAIPPAERTNAHLFTEPKHARPRHTHPSL